MHLRLRTDQLFTTNVATLSVCDGVTVCVRACAGRRKLYFRFYCLHNILSYPHPICSFIPRYACGWGFAYRSYASHVPYKCPV